MDPAPIHRSSAGTTSGRQSKHFDCRPSFRHQKTAHLPVSPLWTAVSSRQGKAASRPAYGQARSPHVRQVETEQTRRRFRSCIVFRHHPLNTQTQTVLPCTVYAHSRESYLQRLISLWRLKHSDDESEHRKNHFRQPKTLLG